MTLTTTQILLSVIENLAERLAEANVRLEEFKKEHEEYRQMFSRVVQEKVMLEQEIKGEI